MHDQKDFDMLLDSTKWREYRDAVVRWIRIRQRFDSVVDKAHLVLDTKRLHEAGCNSRSPKVSLLNCDCALSPLAYAVGWNEGHEDDG